MAFDFLGLSSYLYFVYSNVMKSKVLLVLMNLFFSFSLAHLNWMIISSESRGKLTFGNQIGNEVGRADGDNETRRAEIASNAKQVQRKSKYDKECVQY